MARPRRLMLVSCLLGLASCAVGRNDDPPAPGGSPPFQVPHYDLGYVPTFDGSGGQSPLQPDGGAPPPPPPPPDAGVRPDVSVPPPTNPPPTNPPPTNPPPTSGGWGAGCATDAHCQIGFYCVVVIGRPVGYCTQRCGSLGYGCPGTPVGQLAACVIAANDGNYCGFLCRTATGQGYGCPSGLYCSPYDAPPASGQHDCMTP